MSIIDDAMYEIQVKVSEIVKKEGKMIDDAIFGYIQKIADEEGIKLDIHLNRDFIIDALQNRYANTVKHGEWIIDGDCTHCSECRDVFGCTIMGYFTPKHCPSCGARMDGDKII